MTTKEKMIEDILERLKDYEDDTGIIEIWGNQLRLLLKEYLQEEPTYEQWFERWKQVGYKEWRRDSGKDTTEERECENCKKLQKELDWISFSM